MLVSKSKTVDVDQPECLLSENTYLITAGMALVKGNDKMFLEALSNIAEPQRKLLNCKILELEKLNTDLTGLLQFTLHAAVAKWETKLCEEILRFGKNLKANPVLNHETIALAMSHVIYHD